MNTVEFLSHVLAHDGWVCIDKKLKKGFGHRFFRDFQAAADYAQAQDALGETIYFACATFKERTSRKQVNVAYLKSFWGDIDVGQDKPYKARVAAEDALVNFLAATGWPAPTVVHSGTGLHIYWVLDTPITPEEWRPRAEAFRDLCKQHKFHLDHSRTADHSSVLRPPGTHNRKFGSHLVTVAHVSPPVSLGDLPFASRPFKVHAQQYAPVKRNMLIEGAGIYDNLPSDPHKIAAGCAQIRNLRDMKGQIPYQVWIYSVWTLHHCTNGDAIAHEWSSGHQKYSFEETQHKLDQATAPITCKEFSKHNDLCKSCEHWGKISTPLQLGREVLKAEKPQQSASIYSNDDGLYLNTEDKKGQPDRVLISKWPLVLTSICRGERDQNFSLIFTMRAPHMGNLLITIPSGIFFSAAGMSEMHRMGAVIHHPDLMRDYVRKAMDEYHATNAPQTQYSQFGWKDADNAFLVGNRLYSQAQMLMVGGSPEAERRSRMLGPRGGSLTAWSAAANKLFATGCEPQSFALMCAFGAVLMHFVSGDEGGAIISLVSETSGTGKTTALEAVASVWGELGGLRLLDEDTQISRGVFLSVLGNLPCVFDELHKRDPDSIRAFVTMFTSGRDKLRAKADGTLRETAGEWQTILILASNISVTDIIQTKNPEEAQAFRILELAAEQTFTGHEGDKLRRELRENKGWAGEAFIRYLMYPGVLQSVRAELEGVVELLWSKKYGFDPGKHRFWVRALACAYTAGCLAVHLRLLDFSAERILQWVIERCQERKGMETHRDNAQVLNEALYEIWASTLSVDTEWRPKANCLVLCAPSQNRPFLARRVRDSGRMYIMRTWLRKWLTEHNITRASFFADLKKRHIIVNDNKFVTLGAGTDYNTGGQVVCFEIDMHHPDMAGALQAAERDVPGDEKMKKPLNELLRPPAGGAPSPPSTLQ